MKKLGIVILLIIAVCLVLGIVVYVLPFAVLLAIVYIPCSFIWKGYKLKKKIEYSIWKYEQRKNEMDSDVFGE